MNHQTPHDVKHIVRSVPNKWTWLLPIHPRGPAGSQFLNLGEDVPLDVLLKPSHCRTAFTGTVPRLVVSVEVPRSTSTSCYYDYYLCFVLVKLASCLIWCAYLFMKIIYVHACCPSQLNSLSRVSQESPIQLNMQAFRVVGFKNQMDNSTNKGCYRPVISTKKYYNFFCNFLCSFPNTSRLSGMYEIWPEVSTITVETLKSIEKKLSIFQSHGRSWFLRRV